MDKKGRGRETKKRKRGSKCEVKGEVKVIDKEMGKWVGYREGKGREGGKEKGLNY